LNHLIESSQKTCSAFPASHCATTAHLTPALTSAAIKNKLPAAISANSSSNNSKIAASSH
jgi:hypothetical protein